VLKEPSNLILVNWIDKSHVDVNYAVKNIIYKHINHQSKEYCDNDKELHTNQSNLMLNSHK
jgi:hypothetical protein